jgi:hypothetical protein
MIRSSPAYSRKKVRTRFCLSYGWRRYGPQLRWWKRISSGHLLLQNWSLEFQWGPKWMGFCNSQQFKRCLFPWGSAFDYISWCWGIQENTSPSKRRSLIAFSKYVFQEQGIRESRKSETCEVSKSRMCRVRGFWFGEEAKSWTRGSPEPPLRKGRTSEICWFGNLVKTLFGTREQGHARTRGEAGAASRICGGLSSGISGEDIRESRKKQSQSCSPRKSRFRVWTSGRLVNV